MERISGVKDLLRVAAVGSLLLSGPCCSQSRGETFSSDKTGEMKDKNRITVIVPSQRERDGLRELTGDFMLGQLVCVVGGLEEQRAVPFQNVETVKAETVAGQEVTAATEGLTAVGDPKVTVGVYQPAEIQAAQEVCDALVK